MTEPLREGLPPVVGSDARVLILGSFPSERSLATGEYYANRRNQFWPLLGAVFGFDADVGYQRRIDAVRENGVALWDVAARKIVRLRTVRAARRHWAARQPTALE